MAAEAYLQRLVVADGCGRCPLVLCLFPSSIWNYLAQRTGTTLVPVQFPLSSFAGTGSLVQGPIGEKVYSRDLVVSFFRLFLDYSLINSDAWTKV